MTKNKMKSKELEFNKFKLFTRKEVQELLDKGKKKGILSYQEIMDSLQVVPLSPEQIDDMYEALDELGIRVQDEMLRI